MIWPPHFEDITFAAQSLPCGLPLPWFQKNMMVSHLGENPVRKWSQRGGGQWFPSLWSPVFLWKWNILPSFIKKKEKEGERESQSDWYCQGMFLYSPTTSLLPPSESFRIKKRPFTGEDLGIRRKKVNLQRLTNSDCQFLIGYIFVSTSLLLWPRGKYRIHADSTLFCGSSQSRVANTLTQKAQQTYSSISIYFLFTHTGYFPISWYFSFLGKKCIRTKV